MRDSFVYRCLSKFAEQPDPIFEQWGDDTLYPVPVDNESPDAEIASQCGVQCCDKQICKQMVGGTKKLFCHFHEEIANKKTN